MIHRVPVHVTAYSGFAFWTRVNFAPNIQGMHGYSKDVDGDIFGFVRVPDEYVSTPKLEAIILANATSGVTRLIAGTACIAADAVSWDVSAFSDETAQDVTVPATAYVAKLLTFPSSGNLASSANIAAGKILFVHIKHNGDSAAGGSNDTLAVDTLLPGIWFSYSDT